MWRVQLYIFIHRHPKLADLLRKSNLLRPLMPFIFNFDNCYSDRRYMTTKILPALALSKLQRVLFVGCKEYTACYGKRLTRAGIDYWTTDIDPSASAWGEKEHHIVCDIAKIDEFCPAASFDSVLLNGVIGFGVNDESGMNRTVRAIARILRPNGILLIGWDSLKKLPDPIELEVVTSHFRHECIFPLPVRKTFSDTDKVYDWLVKIESPEASAFATAASDGSW
jgi:SAM-dependent methyltransferase